MRSIIYITNTKIPSKKANTYQSMCVCESLAARDIEVNLWHPASPIDYAGKNSSSRDKIDSVFNNLGISKNFKIKRLFSIDITHLKNISVLAWFYIRSISFSFTCLLALQKEDSKKVIFIRDGFTLAVLVLARKLSLIKQKIFFEAHRYAIHEARYSKMADGLVVISHSLKKLYDPDRSGNILVAHDAIRNSELSKRKLSDLNSLNIIARHDSEDKIILYSGNLFAWKGVYTLADCSRYLPLNYKIVFLGGSEDTLPQFQEYVSTIPNIQLLGFKPRSKVREYLDVADVLVLPNSSKHPWSHATSPLKLFEYMATRKPIIASCLPSLKEILLDGENAILFNPDDPRDLAEKIMWVVENDCSKLVEKAWQDVQEYTWDRRAEKIITWMEQLNAFSEDQICSANKIRTNNIES